MSQCLTPADSHHHPSVSPEYQKYPIGEGFQSGPAPPPLPKSHLPVSPPFSCVASQTEAYAFPSPRFSVSTPPASVPMSAEQSNNSLPPTFAAITETDHVMTDGGETIARTTSPQKRKIEDVDTDIENNDSNKRQRTDHERQQEPKANDPGEVGTKPGLSPVYKLCQTPHPISRPHSAQNLVALYGLNKIAASVARKDPKTGEKINKLRKSYEGKVKDFGLSGKNKAVSAPNEFTGLIAFPDEEWHNQRLMGKELAKGFSEDMLSKLVAATNLAPGKLPAEEQERWRNTLAIEEPAPRNALQPAPVNKTVQKQPMHVANPTNNLLKPEIPRPKRKGTKRRYDEDSFEGYGEGYGDDAGTGVSDDGDDDPDGAGAKKKRRKDMGASPGFTSNINQYSAGPVSVGSGSYSGR